MPRIEEKVCLVYESIQNRQGKLQEAPSRVESQTANNCMEKKPICKCQSRHGGVIPKTTGSIKTEITCPPAKRT